MDVAVLRSLLTPEEWTALLDVVSGQPGEWHCRLTTVHPLQQILRICFQPHGTHMAELNQRAMVMLPCSAHMNLFASHPHVLVMCSMTWILHG